MFTKRPYSVHIFDGRPARELAARVTRKQAEDAFARGIKESESADIPSLVSMVRHDRKGTVTHSVKTYVPQSPDTGGPIEPTPAYIKTYRR